MFFALAVVAVAVLLRAPRVTRADRERTREKLAAARAVLEAQATTDPRAASMLAQSYERERALQRRVRRQLLIAVVPRLVVALAVAAYLFVIFR